VTRRRLFVNLVPLLDVLAIMVFAILIQSQAMTRRGLRDRQEQAEQQVAQARKRADEAEQSLAGSRRMNDSLQSDLRESARRAAGNRGEVERLEDAVRNMAAELAAARKESTEEEKKQAEQRALAASRDRSEIAESFQKALGLSEEQTQQMSSSIPKNDTDRKDLLSDARKLRDAAPRDVPNTLRNSKEFSKRNSAVTVYLETDGAVALYGLDGRLAGRFTGGETPEDVQTRLDELMAKLDDGKEFVYVLLAWDNPLVSRYRVVARAVGREVDHLASRPQNSGRKFFRTLLGHVPPDALQPKP